LNRTEVKKVLNTVSECKDAFASIKLLVNLVENLVEKIEDLEDKLQKSKDEINRLKGEQGKPHIRKQSKDDNDNNGSSDHSSEESRKDRGNKPPPKQKSKKMEAVKIDRQITLKISKDELPDDAVFKGYETRVFQDIKPITDNIEFRREIYYSSSLNKTILASLPKGYHGEFGPGVRALILFLYRDSCMTQPAIARFFTTFGIQISMNTISRMITEGHDRFHHEKEDIINTALKMGLYQHIDDTSCRVNGKNHYTHILCGPLFTAFFTRPHKDRLTILEMLCHSELKFDFNHVAYEFMKELGLSEKRLVEVKSTVGTVTLTRSDIDKLLMRLFPNPKKFTTIRRIILEASAITYYRSTDHAIKHLMCDDAPQFKKIALYHSLCWVHEGRHFKKLIPLYTAHQDALDKFIEHFWDFYHALLDYQKNPLPEVALKLSEKFDEIFSAQTCYIALNDRIAKTLSKKESLLLVLEFPFLPLHNNPAELGARVQARMRDINLHTISENGTKAKDTFATIVQTAKKLGVNIYNYFYDRVAEKFEMKALSDLIIEKSTGVFNMA
jgi:hypothetical protein